MSGIVSIVIPNFNKGNLICHSLDSLLRQTYKDWEAIVVDDCSTDCSWNLIQKYVNKDSRIRAFRNETNRGGNYSRNRGERAAKGDYLIFLDSDDWLADDCIENRLLEFMEKGNADVALLIFNMAIVQDGKTGEIWGYGKRKDALLGFLRHEIVWTIVMPIWRRKEFERIGGFDETFPRLQDVELHTRALLKGLKYRFAERESPDCYYFVDKCRMTTNHVTALTNTVDAMLMYVNKFRSCTRDRTVLSSLQETVMAAIRVVGNTFQAGYVDGRVRDALVRRILSFNDISIWVRIYAILYRLKINKIHGFNKLYRLVYRVLK